MFHSYIYTLLNTLDLDPRLLETPQDRSLGDFAFPCFTLAKEYRKAPAIIATELALKCSEMLDDNVWYISKVVSTGPYVNFFLNREKAMQHIVGKIFDQWTLFGQWENKWKTVLVEWRSPNTHKMLHIWHLRNALVSESICSILECAWYDVIRSAYGGDIWAHVAKRLRYFQKFTDQKYPSDPEEFGIRSWWLYRDATMKVDEDPIYKDEVHEVQRLLEAWDESLVKLRQTTRELSIQWLQKAFDDLWCSIQRFYRESDVEQPGIELVQKFLNDDALPHIRMSEWAVIADLEEFDLWVFLLLKSNGTSLYSTKDLALAHLKDKEYDFDTSLYVVATEQNHHFAQLFKTLDITWYDASKLHHMWYELVELPTGKMSSRKWTVIPYHIWRDDAHQQALALIQWRDIPNIEQVASDVAFAALKFSMLLQDTYKKIRIDMHKSISFDGETGPYLQYTYARMSSILHNSSLLYTYEDAKHLNQDTEKFLIMHLSEFPAVVQKSAQEYKPSLVARYVLELCREFNSYYQSTKVITEDDQSTRARLALVSSVKQVLKNGLTLLWIQTPQKM